MRGRREGSIFYDARRKRWTAVVPAAYSPDGKRKAIRDKTREGAATRMAQAMSVFWFRCFSCGNLWPVAVGAFRVTRRDPGSLPTHSLPCTQCGVPVAIAANLEPRADITSCSHPEDEVT